MHVQLMKLKLLDAVQEARPLSRPLPRRRIWEYDVWLWLCCCFLPFPLFVTTAWALLLQLDRESQVGFLWAPLV